MKRKGISLLISFFIVLTVSLPGQIDQTGLLPEEICKPLCFLVQDSVFYISDQNQIFCFSNENMQLLWKTGGKGEGPEEFRITPIIKTLDDGLIAGQPFNMKIYSKSGTLIKQFKTDTLLWDFDCINGKFILASHKIVKGEMLFSITLNDADLHETHCLFQEKKKESKSGKIEYPLISPLKKFVVRENEIYTVFGNQNFMIRVLDDSGNEIRKIEHEYRNRMVTEKDEQRLIDAFFDTLHSHQTNLSQINKNTVFPTPDHFPAIEDFKVDSDRIYVKTYRRRSEGAEFIVLDRSGRILGKTILPDMNTRKYDIRGNVLYSIEEDETENRWKIHKRKIVLF